MKKTDKIKKTVFFHNQDDFYAYSRVYCSDSEYGFFLLMHILDSYQLNLASDETFSDTKCSHEFLGVEIGI